MSLPFLQLLAIARGQIAKAIPLPGKDLVRLVRLPCTLAGPDERSAKAHRRRPSQSTGFSADCHGNCPARHSGYGNALLSIPGKPVPALQEALYLCPLAACLKATYLLDVVPDPPPVAFGPGQP